MLGRGVQFFRMDWWRDSHLLLGSGFKVQRSWGRGLGASRFLSKGSSQFALGHCKDETSKPESLNTKMRIPLPEKSSGDRR